MNNRATNKATTRGAAYETRLRVGRLLFGDDHAEAFAKGGRCISVPVLSPQEG